MRLRRLLLAITVLGVPACGDSGGSGALLQPPTLLGLTTQDIAVSNTPGALVVADVNDDGDLDLVVGGAGGVQICRGSPGGVMTAAASPAGTSFLSVSALAVGLLNNDALPDLVVGLSGSGDLEVYLNTGNATAPFDTFSGYAATDDAVGGLALVDVDDDGELDAVTANPANHSVSVLLGTGTGAFGAATEYAAGLGARSVAAADFDGDGLPDLVTANELGDSASILIGTGADPFFEAPGFLPAGDEPRCVAVADYNGDGRPDLAVLSYVSSELVVYLGKANGSFGPPLTTPLSTGHAWLAAGDLSDDGRQDLLVVGVNLFNPVYLAGRGNGQFIPMNVLDPLGDPLTVNGHQGAGAVGDFNGDGLLDLAIAFGSLGTSTVRVQLTDTVSP